MMLNRFGTAIAAGFIFLLLVCGGFAYFVLHDRHKEEVTPIAQPVTQATSTPFAPAFVHKVVGHSVQGRDIDEYTYGTGPTDLMFVGGMHGGYEWNSVLLAYDFMDYLTAHPEVIPQDMSITVIPSANPDGVFKVIGKEGRFTLDEAPKVADPSGTGRLNADGVDLNRNFDCNWAPQSTWQNKTVSAGTAPFSEPESQAIKAAVEEHTPVSVVFWHSQAGAVYASECHDGVLPVDVDIMNAYAHAAGYPAVKSFDAYPITGDSEGWLASIGIPALTVELKTHATVEWNQNLAGITALINYFENKKKTIVSVTEASASTTTATSASS